MSRPLIKIIYTFFVRDQAAAEELIEELETVIGGEIDGPPINKKTDPPALAIVDRSWTKTDNQDSAFLASFWGLLFYSAYWTLAETDTDDSLYSEALSETIFGKLSKERYHGLY